MIIKAIVVGELETNCYIAGDEAAKEAFIIDPGAGFKRIKDEIALLKLKPIAVINTHGHGDHILANDRFDVPVWIHRLDAEFLLDHSKNLSGAFGFPFAVKPAERLLEDKDILNLGQYKFEVIHTPGHTPGSICLKADNIIFTGDTLFHEGVGRTDFSYGSEEDIKRSIKEKLLVLDDNCVIYPGHGSKSTIGYERKYNPFII